MIDEKALRRIRALTDLAAHPNTSKEESDAAMERAMSLMSLYGIEHAHLVADGQVKDEIGVSTIALTDPYSYAKSMLLHHLAEALRCKSVATEYHGQRYTEAKIVGSDSDRERVEMLYTALLLQSFSRMHEVRGRTPSYTKMLRNSYLRGFGVRIGQRLAEIERGAIAEDVASSGTGAEVVLHDRKSEVDKFYAVMFPLSKKIKTRRRIVAHAYESGQAEADRADLGQTRMGHNSRALPAGGGR